MHPATRILCGLLLGAIAALIARAVDAEATWLVWATQSFIEPAGQVFLRLIFMIVVPLIVTGLLLATAELENLGRLRLLALRCGAITLLLSAVSVAIALVLVNTIQPGLSLPEEKRERLVAEFGGAAQGPVATALQQRPWQERVLEVIPKNPLNEAARALTPEASPMGLLALMFFALLFGAAVGSLPAEQKKPLIAVSRSLFEACLVVTRWAMRLAPLGVACLIFATTLRVGIDLLQTLALYAAVVVGGLLLHATVTYSVVLRTLGGTSPLGFFRLIRPVLLTAFSTSSSNATLPVALDTAERQLRLHPTTARFVLTIGATANQNGTALYEGITVLFLAQVFGVALGWEQQLTVALLCLVAGIGTAGIPGGSLPLVVGVLVTIGVPSHAIALILGIDRLLDMCRTTVNVAGDLVCAQVVDRWSGPSPRK